MRRVTFDADGAAVTDTAAFGTPLARTTTLTRGGDKRITDIVDPYGRRTAFSYDGQGRVTGSRILVGTDDEASMGSVAYGAFDLPTTVTDAAGKSVAYAYDEKGNQTSQTDRQGRVTRFTYTSTGQVRTVEDPPGKVTTIGYTITSPSSVEDGSTT